MGHGGISLFVLIDAWLLTAWADSILSQKQPTELWYHFHRRAQFVLSAPLG